MGAGAVRVTVPVLEDPPLKEFGFSDSDRIVAGLIVKDADSVDEP